MKLKRYFGKIQNKINEAKSKKEPIVDKEPLFYQEPVVA